MIVFSSETFKLEKKDTLINISKHISCQIIVGKKLRFIQVSNVIQQQLFDIEHTYVFFYYMTIIAWVNATSSSQTKCVFNFLLPEVEKVSALKVVKKTTKTCQIQ